MREIACDVLVVGSGPGGAATAATLAAAGVDVVVAEEGEATRTEVPPYSVADMDRHYRNGGMTVALGNPSVAYAEGRCVGGGSEVNAGLYHRLPPDTLEAWTREYGLQGLGSGLDAYFDRVERDLNVSYAGELCARKSLKMKEGAERLGWLALEVPRWISCHRQADGTITEQRHSMSRTLLPRAIGSGARLVTGVRIERLDMRRSRAVAAEGAPPGDAGRSGASFRFDHVFVCAGAIGTPAILRRSGVRRGIGRMLRMHPTLKLVAEFESEVNDEPDRIGVHQVKEFSPRMSFGCSISSPPFLAAALADSAGAALADCMQRYRRMAVFYVMVRSAGTGGVTVLPWARDPLVTFAVTDEDLRDLAAGLHRLGRLLFAAGAVRLFPSVKGYPVMETEAQLEVFLKPIPRAVARPMTIHLAGSCPMGKVERSAATDSYGKLHGLDNVWINDASLLPEAPGVNPMGTVVALAYRNAERFLADRARS